MLKLVVVLDDDDIADDDDGDDTSRPELDLSLEMEILLNSWQN